MSLQALRHNSLTAYRTLASHLVLVAFQKLPLEALWKSKNILIWTGGPVGAKTGASPIFSFWDWHLSFKNRPACL